MKESPVALKEKGGFINGIVHLFLTSHLSIIFLIASLLAGLGAVISTPREEDPQIVVPIADIIVTYPGASAKEVEQLVARPLESLMWQIDGVEYVYSRAQRGMAMITVRFFVGEDRERSLIKLHSRVSMHMDKAPQGVNGWLVKPVDINDVPIVSLCLYSKNHDSSSLRRIGEEALARLEGLEDISRTEIIGGNNRIIRVEPDLVKLAGYGLTIFSLSKALKAADSALDSGNFSNNDKSIEISAGPFLTTLEDIKSVVVGVHDHAPVYLSDVAEIKDEGEEPVNYTRIGFGPGRKLVESIKDIPNGASYEAVNLAIAKKKGTNAVDVAQSVLDKVEELKKTVIPEGVEILVTRNYGETANSKVDELLSSLLFAVISVVILISLTMGWREGLVVAAAVPVSFSLALFVNWQAGFTINRVTLFALILSLGLVVDDPITNVDNIQRHLRMKKKNPEGATMAAVNEVLPPVIMSTVAIIVSFLPMFFITGMMGPYMGPMAINVPLTVTFSTICALTFVPWLACKLLKGKYYKTEQDPDKKKKGSEKPENKDGRKNNESDDSDDSGENDGEEEPTPPWIINLYKKILSPFMTSKLKSGGLLLLIVLLLGFCGGLVYTRRVPLKMLPFDNKGEFLLVLDMPEGTTLERTDQTIRKFEQFLETVPEVTTFQAFSGIHSPVDFNGLVRHYYVRQGPNVGEVRVNLIDKGLREDNSHTICLRLRNALTEIAANCGGNLKIVEIPPGPPVMSTIVAEIYGKPGTDYDEMIRAARKVRVLISGHKGVVDIDDSTESKRERLRFFIDKEKAAIHGIPASTVVQAISMALRGHAAATLHDEDERHPLTIKIQLNEAQRSGTNELLMLTVPSSSGSPVPLSELGKFQNLEVDQPIYHKNLKPVVFVYAEMAGRAPGETIIDIQAELSQNPLKENIYIEWAGEGEWRITLTVFRDLGIAFGVALIGMYILITIQTNSFFMPLIIMTAIPLTAIGIMPGFWLMNHFNSTIVNGWDDLIFFTATGMIGMIALGGIVVRNSIVLIEFIQGKLEEGGSMREAILVSGAVRSRPILLTAATTAIGAWPITYDPIFSGLAWSLIFGLFASTAFTLLVVPVVFNISYGNFNNETESSAK
jgi:multidrug efflux pump subunit AcrB